MPSLDSEVALRSVYALGAFTGSHIFALILGVTGMTGEYRYQTITPTLLVSPRRGRVVLAKMAAHVGVGLAYGVAAVVTALVVGAAVNSVRGYDLGLGSGRLWGSMLLAAVAVALDESRARLGLRPDPDLNALRNELVVCFAPPALHDPAFGLPARFRSFHPGSAPAPSSASRALGGLGIDQPLVYATLGTVFNDAEEELPFFPAVLAGLRDAPVDVLVVVGPNVDPSSLGDQRQGVRVVPYVEQRAVLDRCAVVICHGGYGTLLDAIDAGVPVIVVPFGADQHLNAATVRRLGIGIVVDEESLSQETIRGAVDELLEPSARQRAIVDALRRDWRSLPGPADAVAALVALTQD
jgi:UDP:flavonoid glycosyltransferase YjiC (YdhE family)